MIIEIINEYYKGILSFYDWLHCELDKLAVPIIKDLNKKKTNLGKRWIDLLKK